jgi:hypothetical protein
LSNDKARRDEALVPQSTRELITRSSGLVRRGLDHLRKVQVTDLRSRGEPYEPDDELLDDIIIRGGELYRQEVNPRFEEWAQSLRQELDLRPEADIHLKDVWALLTGKEENLIRKYKSEMSSINENTRIGAIVGLRMIAGDGQAEELLKLALSDESRYVRVLAAEALSQEKKQAQVAVQVLINALDTSGDPENREYLKDWQRVAAGALGNYEKEAESALSALVKTLSNSDYNVRGYAARSLGRIGVPSQFAIGRLEQAISIEEDENVRNIMIESLDTLRGRK